MRGILIVALVGGLVLAGCTDPSTDGQAGTGPLDIQVQQDRTQLEEGDQVEVRVTITHEGNDTYVYEHPGCPPEPFKVVASGQGEQIDLYPYGDEAPAGTCAVREVEIQPGQSFEYLVQWNGNIEEAQPDPHEPPRAPAGSYTITAELSRADQGPTFAETATLTVR